MTTVYVLEGSFEYDGSIILGVYTSMERAEDEQEQYLRRLAACTDRSMARFDEYHIHAVAVNATAEEQLT